MGASRANPSLHEPRLSSLASHAAIELDCIVLGRPFSTDALSQLYQTLRRSIPEVPGQAESLCDPAAIVVFHYALKDACGNASSHVDELRKQADIFLGRLLRSAESEKYGTKDIEEIRDCCIAIAKHARADEAQSPVSRKSHPFKA